MITLKKAIEILNIPLSTKDQMVDINYVRAVQLGFEALKDIKAIRATFLLIDFGRLPGETKEKP